MSRKVAKVFNNQEQGEGRGARVFRSLGHYELRNLDPFLMLDEAHATHPAGFPDHPHRGFETVTYLLKGTFSHEDSKGNKGILNPGDLQWMTAGKGVVHCEMPIGNEPTRGLQLWVNLSKQYKMIEPHYQDLKDNQIPRASHNGVHVKVIAGTSMNITSPVYTRTPMMYLDFKVDRGGSYSQEIPRHWNGFIYILEGSGTFGPTNNPTKASKRQTVLLTKEDEDFITFRNDDLEQLHFVLIVGQPLNEPVVQHGPFVMNTQAEIEQTFQDYQLGRNVFESARNWRSDYIKSTSR